MYAHKLRDKYFIDFHLLQGNYFFSTLKNWHPHSRKISCGIQHTACGNRILLDRAWNLAYSTAAMEYCLTGLCIWRTALRQWNTAWQGSAYGVQHCNNGKQLDMARHMAYSTASTEYRFIGLGIQCTALRQQNTAWRGSASDIQHYSLASSVPKGGFGTLRSDTETTHRPPPSTCPVWKWKAKYKNIVLEGEIAWGFLHLLTC